MLSTSHTECFTWEGIQSHLLEARPFPDTIIRIEPSGLQVSTYAVVLMQLAYFRMLRRGSHCAVGTAPEVQVVHEEEGEAFLCMINGLLMKPAVWFEHPTFQANAIILLHMAKRYGFKMLERCARLWIARNVDRIDLLEHTLAYLGQSASIDLGDDDLECINDPYDHPVASQMLLFLQSHPEDPLLRTWLQTHGAQLPSVILVQLLRFCGGGQTRQRLIVQCAWDRVSKHLYGRPIVRGWDRVLCALCSDMSPHATWVALARARRVGRYPITALANVRSRLQRHASSDGERPPVVVQTRRFSYPNDRSDVASTTFLTGLDPKHEAHFGCSVHASIHLTCDVKQERFRSGPIAFDMCPTTNAHRSIPCILEVVVSAATCTVFMSPREDTSGGAFAGFHLIGTVEVAFSCATWRHHYMAPAVAPLAAVSHTIKLRIGMQHQLCEFPIPPGAICHSGSLSWTGVARVT